MAAGEEREREADGRVEGCAVDIADDPKQSRPEDARRNADSFAKKRVCYDPGMKAKDALDTLRRSEGALRARGVVHAALFGSVARGENRPESDIDILVEFDPDAHVTVFDYVGVKDYIASLFAQPVDVIDREALKPHLRQPAVRDAVYAF
jgi:uncharacterized protein